MTRFFLPPLILCFLPKETFSWLEEPPGWVARPCWSAAPAGPPGSLGCGGWRGGRRPRPRPRTPPPPPAGGCPAAGPRTPARPAPGAGSSPRHAPAQQTIIQITMPSSLSKAEYEVEKLKMFYQ